MYSFFFIKFDALGRSVLCVAAAAAAESLNLTTTLGFHRPLKLLKCPEFSDLSFEK